MAVVKEIHENKQLIAYYVPKDASVQVEPTAFREYLKPKLPAYMIPAIFIFLDKMPLTPNGKINRKALMNREVIAEKPEKESARDISPSELENELVEIWKETLTLPAIDPEDGFFELGGNSFPAVMTAEKIEKRMNRPFSVTELFQHPTVKSLCRYLGESGNPARTDPVVSTEPKKPLKAKVSEKPSYPEYYETSTAVIGISCNFPGAENITQFWNNLLEGKESGGFFSEEELRELRISEKIIQNPDYVPRHISIKGKDHFDRDFFKMSPRDVVIMGPGFTQLMLHSWQAVEDAGYAPERIPETGVFMTANHHASAENKDKNDDIMENPDQYVRWMLSQPGSIPTLISYKLGLKGPSLFVHSNCSSSLTALHLAHRSLINREADYALVGGAAILPWANRGYVHRADLNFSSDGHCKAFDASADGMTIGEGVAVILLKRASAAVKDRDHIYAILRGTAVNNDGAEKAGFYAPGVKGQARVIQKVFDSTKIDPESVNYIEAHGAGTKLGDPIEITALKEAFENYTDQKRFCGIGSVKSNIGHLDTAAGLAGAIKVMLSLYHGKIPPSINYTRPNPEINFKDSPFFPVERPISFKKDKFVKRAGLSSFGIGGTNGHAIFEAYESEKISEAERPIDAGPYIIPLSAVNEDRLKKYAKDLADFLKLPEKAEEIHIADAAYTLQLGRRAMDRRVAVLAGDINELIEKLENVADDRKDCKDVYRGDATEVKDAIVRA